MIYANTKEQFNLCSVIYQVLKSKDEDFQISIVCVLVIKLFALLLAEVDVFECKYLISSFSCWSL